MFKKFLLVASILLVSINPSVAQQCNETKLLPDWSQSNGYEEVASFEGQDGSVTRIFRNNKKDVMVFKTKGDLTCLVDMGLNFQLANWNEARL